MSTHDLRVTAAMIRLHDGRLSPFACIDERWFWIETKPSLVTLGIATVIPMTAEWEMAHAVEPRLSAIVPADPADGRPEPFDLDCATDDPQVVALARRFNELAEADALVPGPLLCE